MYIALAYLLHIEGGVISPATSINAPTLANIGARRITQMSDLWSFLANFGERR
jgi:hypothetical protein